MVQGVDISPFIRNLPFGESGAVLFAAAGHDMQCDQPMATQTATPSCHEQCLQQGAAACSAYPCMWSLSLLHHHSNHCGIFKVWI